MLKNIFLRCCTSALIFSLLSCGGGSSNPTSSPSISNSSSVTAALPPECVLRQTTAKNPEAPEITLIGERILNIPLGSTYLDAGATAKDRDGIDLTATIVATGLDKLDTSITGDYFIRYQVKDGAGRPAIAAHRILRVFDSNPKKYSLRTFGSTTAPMGFLEHLPTYIGSEPQMQYPLLIVAHGWEHFVQQSPENNRLLTLTYGANIYRVFDGNFWPDSRPFIVLEPQRCLDIGDNEWHQVDQLIDWALATYPIDPKRIYMTGMSAGGYFTYRFPVIHPNRLAAIAPMSAGGPVESPNAISLFCKAMEKMPIWAFHGDNDKTVPVTDTLFTIDTLNKQCPTPPSPKPKLTLISGGDHVIANRIWDDSYVGRGNPNYDIQTESIYDWLLKFKLEDN